MSFYEVAHAECIGAMGAMESGSVDVVISDPPYSEHVHANGWAGKDTGVYGERVDFGFEHLDPETLSWSAYHMARLARRWIAVFTDLESIGDWKRAFEGRGVEYVRSMVWTKRGGQPQRTGDRPAAHAEGLVLCHQRKPNGKPMQKRWNGGGRGNVFEHAVVKDRVANAVPVRVHKTQKPLKLMRELVTLFSDPGELILDPFAGSGTTGVAAKLLGRRFVGFERDRDICAEAQRRIAKTYAPRAVREALEGKKTDGKSAD